MGRRKKAEDPRSTVERQKDFLQAYGASYSIDRASALAEIDPGTHPRWLRKYPEYAAIFQKLKATAAEFLETEAIRRAGEGWEEDIYYQGTVCGQVRRYDSGLMQFLLRGMLPEKYGAKTTIVGDDQAPIQANIQVRFVKAGDDRQN